MEQEFFEALFYEDGWIISTSSV